MLPIQSLLVVSTLILAGCGTYEGMFFTEHTHVGAQIKISPETDAKPVDVKIGYDRGLLAVVPRIAPGENAGSVISKTDLDIVFLTNSTIKNVIATGVAAKNLAQDGANVAALFGQCYDETEDLTKNKKAALAKLEPYKQADADKSKIEKLYRSVYPKRTIHWTTTNDEMIRALAQRISAICDSQADADTLDKFTKML